MQHGELDDHYCDRDDWDRQYEYEDQYDYPRTRKEVSCRNCGSTDVFWGRDANDHWRLYNPGTGKLHTCKKRDLAHRLDAFDAVE